MPAGLRRRALRGPRGFPVPSTGGAGAACPPQGCRADAVDDTLGKIARLASGGAYHDFASVGSSILRRRIERRQRRLGVTSQSQYLATLERDAGELESLRAGLLGT